MLLKCSGKSALVLFNDMFSCVQYKVLVILVVLHLNSVCLVWLPL